MEQNIPIGGEPFSTTDKELALSLLTAGCKLHERATQMHFTPDICRNRWVSVNGTRQPLLPNKPVTPVEFERAVQRAVKLGIPGVVTYYIVRDDTFREAIKMHDLLAHKFHEAKGGEMDFPALNTLTEAQAAMVVCFARRASEKHLPSYYFTHPPTLVLSDMRKQTQSRDGVPQAVAEQVSYKMEGTGKIWTLNLSDEARARVLPGDSKPFLHPQPK